jgi:DNA-binding NarL/FixJ family response regulator
MSDACGANHGYAYPFGGRSERSEGRPMSGVVVTKPGMVLDAEETELVRLLAEGLVLDAVARRLAPSERTVRRRIRALCDRFEVDTPVQVVVLAAQNGVL